MTLFASAFPLAAAVSILFLFIEGRADLFKLLYVYQRPRVRRYGFLVTVKRPSKLTFNQFTQCLLLVDMEFSWDRGEGQVRKSWKFQGWEQAFSQMGIWASCGCYFLYVALQTVQLSRPKSTFWTHFSNPGWKPGQEGVLWNPLEGKIPGGGCSNWKKKSDVGKGKWRFLGTTQFSILGENSSGQCFNGDCFKSL